MLQTGDKVRHHSCANGWMFGTVQGVRKGDDGPVATVHFPEYRSRYQPYPEQTREIGTFLLERCS